MTRSGAVAERLGRGLQSLVQRFESARRLLGHRLERVSRHLPAMRSVLPNGPIDRTR